MYSCALRSEQSDSFHGNTLRCRSRDNGLGFVIIQSDQAQLALVSGIVAATIGAIARYAAIREHAEVSINSWPNGRVFAVSLRCEGRVRFLAALNKPAQVCGELVLVRVPCLLWLVTQGQLSDTSL